MKKLFLPQSPTFYHITPHPLELHQLTPHHLSEMDSVPTDVAARLMAEYMALYFERDLCVKSGKSAPPPPQPPAGFDASLIHEANMIATTLSLAFRNAGE